MHEVPILNIWRGSDPLNIPPGSCGVRSARALSDWQGEDLESVSDTVPQKFDGM